jgi:hypothetical protein
MTALHVAQVNIGRMKAALEDPVMAGFVARLEEINALADRSPGFVWRLKHCVYHTAHVEVLRQRQAWFEKFSGAYTALWWIPKGHTPGIDEAKKRLAHLDAHGPTAFAFTFRNPFPADERFVRGTDWSSFEPCPAA